MPPWLLFAGGLVALLAGLVAVLIITDNWFGDVAAAETTTTTATPTSTTLATTTTTMSTTTTVPVAALVPPPAEPMWTVILHSMATDQFTEEDAIARAENYPDLATGVLLSSNYSSLNPGYWVVFTELFLEEDEARAYVEKLRGLGRCGDCYPRLVSNES